MVGIYRKKRNTNRLTYSENDETIMGNGIDETKNKVSELFHGYPHTSHVRTESKIGGQLLDLGTHNKLIIDRLKLIPMLKKEKSKKIVLEF